MEPILSIDTPYLIVDNGRIRDFCTRYHLTSFSFFGSVIRGNFRPDSDLDIMVEYDPNIKHNFFDFIRLKEDLEEIFTRKIDLADRRVVNQGLNYFRRIGMLQNLPPTHRQISYLLDILLFIRKLKSELERSNESNQISQDIWDEINWYTIIRTANIAQMVDLPARSAVLSLPWEELDQVTDDDIFETPVSDTIRKFRDLLIQSVPELEAAIPSEAEFVERIKKQGFW